MTDMFKRPLDIDMVVKRISAFLDENTGDKRKKTVLIVDDDITYMRTVTGQIPVMFLTGHGDKESVLSVVGLSPVDYLLKTIDKNSLLEKLKHFFAK